jgi:hypothetical protein
MQSVSFSEYENQLMLGAIERPHSAVVLRPDAEIEERVVGFLASQQDFRCMTPIHADEVNRAIRAVAFQVEKVPDTGNRKTLDSLISPEAISKFAMPNRSLAADVSIDFHVVRRVGEDNVSLLAIHERGIGRFLESVAADQTMITQ